jgi:RNA polymerase sigma factor (TIGR02999 family)
LTPAGRLYWAHLLLRRVALPSPSEPITQLLDAARRGDAAAADRVFSALYDELRRIARRERWRLRPGDTLNTTAVVHEAYVRLMHDEAALPWESRAHLLGTAAVAMRRLLIDRARECQALKRGGGQAAVELQDDMAVAVAEASDELLALDEALQRLEAVDSRLARVVELRYFGGLSEEETGRLLGVAERTVRRDWLKAKAFLHASLTR